MRNDFKSWKPTETVNNVRANHLQGAGGHVHLAHGEVQHVGVGVVEILRWINSSIFSKNELQYCTAGGYVHLEHG